MTRPTSDRMPALVLPKPPPWTRLAACRSRWLDLDWIDPDPDQAEQCRAICVVCPVRQGCLRHALATAEPWGIWGGLGPDERAELARLAGYPIPNAMPMHGFRARYAKHGCRCPACRHAHAVYEHQRRHKRAAA